MYLIKLIIIIIIIIIIINSCSSININFIINYK